MKYSKLLKLLLLNHQPITFMENKVMKFWAHFMNKSCKLYHLDMNSFSVELVSNASFDCYPNNTLSSFKNILPEQINLEEEWEVAITELS